MTSIVDWQLIVTSPLLSRLVYNIDCWLAINRNFSPTKQAGLRCQLTFPEQSQLPPSKQAGLWHQLTNPNQSQLPPNKQATEQLNNWLNNMRLLPATLSHLLPVGAVCACLQEPHWQSSINVVSACLIGEVKTDWQSSIDIVNQPV